MQKCFTKINLYKNKSHSFTVVFMMCMFVSILGTHMSYASARPDLSVRVGNHNKSVRVVFDWMKITKYSVSKKRNTVIVSFNRTATPNLRALRLSKNRFINKISIVNKTKSTLKLAIQLKPNVTYKHYRLAQKVIFDFKMGKSVTQKVTSKAVKKTHQKTDENHNDKIKAASVEKVTEHPLPAKHSVIKKNHAVKGHAVIEPVENAKKPPVLKAHKDRKNKKANQPTVISLSMIEAANLAVFKRFGYLWIVADSNIGNIPPEKFGPLSRELGEADKIQVKNGVGYRYRLPKDVDIVVNKESLSWQIILTNNIEKVMFSNAHIITESDNKGRIQVVVTLPPVSGKILMVKDPTIGDELWIAPVSLSGLRVGQSYDNSDIEILPAVLGMVLRSKRDDLKVERQNNKVYISAKGGLNLTQGINMLSERMQEKSGSTHKRRIFDFPNWRQGGVQRLRENKRDLEKELLTVKSPEDRAVIFLRLALLHFSNGFSHEAISFLEMVVDENPKLAKKPSYLAIRGAVRVLAGQYPEGLEDLSIDALKNQDEAKLWRGYAAAATEQWTMALEMFPQNTSLLQGYPDRMVIAFTLYMAESSLRVGQVVRAREFLTTLDSYLDELSPRDVAAMSYLKGEAYRQEGEADKAIRIWKKVKSGRDRLYHAKAGLARAVLQSQTNKISVERALEDLENLRYAWRGDSLEIRILHNIGKFRIKANKYKEGLDQLRKAVILAKGNLEDSAPITGDMTKAFMDLYVNGAAQNIPSLEAIAVFDEFNELVPSGVDGSIASQNFAEYLVKLDLLDRAVSVLEEQVGNYKGNVEGSRIGAKMASIYLLDGKPRKAIQILDKTKNRHLPKELIDERKLLQARAFSQLNEVQKAIGALAGMTSDNAQKLRADIYWRAHKWLDAGKHLEKIVQKLDNKKDKKIKSQRLLNMAVAFKLAGKDTKLRSMKGRYMKFMSNTALAPSFVVVTRVGGGEEGSLSDRQTMLGLAAEVDIFKSFLDGYQASSE